MTQPGLHIFPRASRMKPCLFLSACICFWQGSMPCFGRIAVVFQSLPEICPQISQRRGFADEELWHLFFPSMVRSLPGYSPDVAWTWGIVPFEWGFSGLVCLFENPITPSLARHNPSDIEFSHEPLHFCRRFLFFFGNVFFFGFLFGCSSTLWMREQTLTTCFASWFVFFRIDFREDRVPFK